MVAVRKRRGGGRRGGEEHRQKGKRGKGRDEGR